MTEDTKPSTWADKQVEKLESLKRMKEHSAQAPKPATVGAPAIRTAAERTLERLEAMRLRLQPDALTAPIPTVPPAAAPQVVAVTPVPPPEISPSPAPLSGLKDEAVLGEPMPVPSAALPDVPAVGSEPSAEPGPDADPSTATVSLGHHAFPRFEGKYKSVKLTLAQMRVLEQLFTADHRLYPGRILRIALNLWMGLPNQIPEDRELEPIARQLLTNMRRPSESKQS